MGKAFLVTYCTLWFTVCILHHRGGTTHVAGFCTRVHVCNTQCGFTLSIVPSILFPGIASQKQEVNLNLNTLKVKVRWTLGLEIGLVCSLVPSPHERGLGMRLVRSYVAYIL